MSARDRLLYHLEQHLTVPTARGLVDAFAHELAEGQRNWDAEAAGFTDPQSAAYAVADLIDPAKESDRG